MDFLKDKYILPDFYLSESYMKNREERFTKGLINT